jgi:hypothetical protein
MIALVPVCALKCITMRVEFLFSCIKHKCARIFWCVYPVMSHYLAIRTRPGGTRSILTRFACDSVPSPQEVFSQNASGSETG